ncbi:hypothetical protein [Methanosarcina acetivorans]|nr:hypothetical protein [Methanosarcina acetivorans]
MRPVSDFGSDSVADSVVYSSERLFTFHVIVKDEKFETVAVKYRITQI